MSFFYRIFAPDFRKKSGMIFRSNGHRESGMVCRTIDIETKLSAPDGCAEFSLGGWKIQRIQTATLFQKI